MYSAVIGRIFCECQLDPVAKWFNSFLIYPLLNFCLLFLTEIEIVMGLIVSHQNDLLKF